MTRPRSTLWPSCGEMGQRIRATDWSATPLGPIEAWPEGFKRTIDILLRLPMPAILAWGEDGVVLYNDACAVFAETLHPPTARQQTGRVLARPSRLQGRHA